MPVLFGNTYLLPAMIVVVLLVLLLALVALRKRSTPAGGPKPVKKEKANKKSKKPTEIAKGSPVLPEADAPQAVVKTTEQVPVEEPAPESVVAPEPMPVSTPAPRRSEPMQREDPIRGILDDIVHGWGDVTDEDFRRLSMFRAEKVQAAVTTFELPKGLKNDQHAHSRLSQLRQYAADLTKETEADRLAGAFTTASEEPALQRPTADPAEETTEVTVPAEPAPAALPLSNFFGTPPVPPVPALTDEELAAESVAEKAEEPIEVETPALVTEMVPVPETAFEAVPEVVPEIEPVPVAVVPVEETAVVESMVETDAENVAEPLPALQTESAFIPDTGEAQLEVQSVSAWRDFDAQPASEWQTEETPIFVEERPDDLEPDFRAIKTGEDLLALPAGERSDMVVHLEPAELCKVFEKTDDTELKKSIIDTLEHVSNPASLEVLRVCLDDPDPQIQLYALDAADRLLGVE